MDADEFIEKAEKIPLNNKEYEEIAKHFGKDNVCFFHKDTKGYYCGTHRARTPSYENISDIPKDKFEFIKSTS